MPSAVACWCQLVLVVFLEAMNPKQETLTCAIRWVQHPGLLPLLEGGKYQGQQSPVSPVTMRWLVLG